MLDGGIGVLMLGYVGIAMRQPEKQQPERKRENIEHMHDATEADKTLIFFSVMSFVAGVAAGVCMVLWP